MQCPKCHKTIEDNATVCQHCNKVLLLECPNCHSLGDSAVCQSCGYTILVKCSKCSRITPLSLDKCPKCKFPTQTSLAYQECESDEFASMTVSFNSLAKIKRLLKSKELYSKFFYRLKNLLTAQLKGVEGKFIIYDDKFVFNFNKELSFTTSVNKAVRTALKIVNSFVGLNINILSELGVPLNLNILIAKKASEQLQDFVVYDNNVKLLTLKKNDKKYLKGLQIVLDQYACDEISKDYKTDSLYSQEENGKSTMFYEIILDSYVLPPSKDEDDSPIDVVQKQIKNVEEDDAEKDIHSFKVFDINAKCSFKKQNGVDLYNALEDVKLEQGGQIIALRGTQDLLVRSSDLTKYLETRDLRVLRVTCTEEMNYKPWGFFEALFKDFMKLEFHNSFIDLSKFDESIVKRYKSFFELIFSKPVKAMSSEDARFAYMDIFSSFLRGLKGTAIIIDGFENLDDTSLQTLEIYFDKFKNIKPNFIFITGKDASVHSKIKGLLRTNAYTEIMLQKTSMDDCLSTLKSDATDFIQSFYFEKIKENFKGSFLYFQNAIEYLKEAGVLIEFENKLLLKNKKSLVLPKNLKGLYKARIKSYSKKVDFSLLLAYSTILGPRLDFKTLKQLGIKDIDEVIKNVEDAGIVSIKDGIVYIEHYSLLNQVLKASIKKEINNFLAKNILAQIGKGLDDTSKIVALGILEAYKEEYLNLWKVSQLAIKMGDYDAYLKNSLGFLSLVGLIGANISKEDIEENKKEVFNNILLSLYSYSPTKIYHIENLLLIDAINEGDDEKIVKLSNLMLQGALVSSNYTDALRLLHNILSRMPEPTLLVNGAVNTKFLLLSLVNIEILYNIGKFRLCVEVAEDILSVLSLDILEKVKPASFSINLFVNHLLDTLRLAAFAKIQLLDDDVDTFMARIEQKLGLELPERTCIEALQEFLAGKIYSNGDVENVSPLSKVILLILQEFSVLKDDYKRFAQNIYQAKLLALDIRQKEIEIFCDLLIAYSYAQIGIPEKANYIYDDVLEQAENSAMFNILVLAMYFKALLCRNTNQLEEAFQLVKEALVIIQRHDNQAKILYVLFEKLYIELAKEQELSFVDIESEEQKIAGLEERLQFLFK